MTPPVETAPACPVRNALRDELRQATREAHQRLEARMPFFRADFSLDDYRRLLLAFHGFYAPLEARLDVCAQDMESLQWPSRRKTAWLREDLLHLGVSESVLGSAGHCTQLPPLESPADVLGCLYVLEGSTLGGQLIKRHLKASLSLEAASGGRFLQAYGEETGVMWGRFLRCLEAAEEWDAEPRKRLIETATVSFERFEDWLAHCGILREPVER